MNLHLTEHEVTDLHAHGLCRSAGGSGGHAQECERAWVDWGGRIAGVPGLLWGRRRHGIGWGEGYTGCIALYGTDLAVIGKDIQCMLSCRKIGNGITNPTTACNLKQELSRLGDHTTQLYNTVLKAYVLICVPFGVVSKTPLGDSTA